MAELLGALVDVVTQPGDPYAAVKVHSYLGQRARDAENMTEAAEHAAEAVRHARLGRRVLEEAEELVLLGECTMDSDRAQALNCWRLALDIYQRSGNPQAAELRDRIAAAAP